MESSILTAKTIQLVRYRESLLEDWDEFITSRALNSTFLHSRKFFNHNQENALDDASLIFYKDRKIIAVLPAVIHQKDGQLIFHSHLRATYGGFVVSDRVGVEESIEMVELTILFAKGENARQIIIRNPFRIFHHTLCDETDYAMWFHGFEIKSRELEVAIPLINDLAEIRSKYHNDVARNVKKAWKNLKVSQMDDLREFWELLIKCQMERHGKAPVHDYTSICNLIDNVGKDRILAFGVYYNDLLVGGCIVFNANDLVLHGQYIASNYEFQHLKPVHALMDFVIEYGHKNGYRYFNFGMANEDEGRTINYGLFSIKEHFGGRGVLRETMHLCI